MWQHCTLLVIMAAALAVTGSQTPQKWWEREKEGCVQREHPGPVAKGIFGSVYRAHMTVTNDDVKTQQLVAVKVIVDDVTHAPFEFRFQELCVSEYVVKPLCLLNHPTWDEAAIVMEWAGPLTIDDLYDSIEYVKVNKKLTQGTAYEPSASAEARLARSQYVAWCMTQALIACHDANVLHRDVKPANILVTPEGAVKLCDFGLSIKLEKGTLVDGKNVGSPIYSSPRVLLQEYYGEDADWHSLGASVYLMDQCRQPMGCQVSDYSDLMSWHQQKRKLLDSAQPGMPEMVCTFVALLCHQSVSSGQVVLDSDLVKQAVLNTASGRMDPPPSFLSDIAAYLVVKQATSS